MGKGSSKGHTPREAKDNLKSTQMLSVIDAISEGPVEGPVDGLKSVLLNSTPVLDSEGNTNISGVTVVFRAGEQEQTPPEGFESSGSETVLGTEVKYDTPITRTITSANIDRLRFTFGVQALVETTSKGDRNPSEVRLLVQIQRNGGWVTEKDITIKGKTTSQYLASVVVGNLPPRPFNIRMRRMTPDSTTDQLQNKTLWSSYTEIMKTGAEAIRALATQLPAFRQKLSDGWYQVRIAGRDAGENELSARLNEPLANGAVIHIVPRLAGAKSGGIFQAVLGAALIATAIWMPGLSIVASNLMFSLGAGMVLGGVAQMLAPKAKTPKVSATDNGKQNTYFSSLDNMVAQGNVLPVLYGEMRVGSRVASQEISTADEGDGGQVVVIGR